MNQNSLEITQDMTTVDITSSMAAERHETQSIWYGAVKMLAEIKYLPRFKKIVRQFEWNKIF